ncbi:TetR/AcrR family transcriptional regulator [Pantoea agglomerans]|uniref:TetR/AcrR family transcriptional regulator n=1 Tax=Enterobacter agglomerans TaxID=549 RepID=UPI0037CAC0ED
MSDKIIKELTVPGPRGRRRVNDESGKKAILRHSLSFFARYGYKGTSLRALAAEAGVDMAMIGKSFGSKSALWQANVKQILLHLEELRPVLKELGVMATTSPREAMIQFLEHFTEFSLEYPELLKFMLGEVTETGDRQNTIISEILQPFREQSLPIIRQAMQAGYVKGDDPDIVLGMIFASISLPIVSPIMFLNREIPASELRDVMVNKAIELFVASYQENIKVT